MAFTYDGASVSLEMPEPPQVVDYHYVKPDNEGTKWVASIYAYDRGDICGNHCDHSKIKLLFRFEVL